MAENTYTNAVLMDLFIIHGQCNKIISRTCRKFNEKYPNLPQINNRKFIRIQNNFVNFGSSLTAPKNMLKPVTSDEVNEVNVLAYFHANPQSSIRRAEQDLNVPYSSVQRILANHKMHNYKLTKVQALMPQDCPQRMEFCERLFVHIQEDPNFLKKVIWTDESKFSREGIYNARNRHYWATENPHVTREAGFQVRFSFNVFCMLMDNKISYVIYDEKLTSRKYLDILKTAVEDFTDSLPIDKYLSSWYQLDGAPAHCTQEVSMELDRLFEDRWIRRLGPWNWPPRSPDITPLDFYLWGTLKDKVYNQTPIQNREELERRVIQAIENLDPLEIRNATTNAVHRRIRKCLEVNGQRFEHLLK